MAEPSTSTEMVRVPILGENGRISDDYIPASIPQAVTAAEQAAESAASSASQALQQAAAAEKAASSATGSVEQAKTYADNASTYMTTAESHAESAATDAHAASGSASAAAASAAAAEESNKLAAQSSADAMGFRNNAVQYRDQAREAAQEAQGYVTTVQQLEQNATNSAAAAQNSATSASASAETATTAASQASASATNAAASAQTASEKAASVLDHYIESAQATTLEPGQQATATVADKVLQLGIPKGDKGDPGDVSAVQAAEGSDLSVSTDEDTVTIDDSALRARIAELENQAANVVTGTSTGLVAHGEDAYAQKPIEVWVKGRTWVNRWPVLSGTHNGITVATDGTGLVTVTGAATADADVTADVSGWATGKSYTTMVNATPTGCSAYFEVQKPSGNTSINASTTGATLNVASDATNCVAGIHVTSGTTVNTSFRVMLVDGAEAPDCFTPCASITSVQPENLVTAGKNLVQGDLYQASYASAAVYLRSNKVTLPFSISSFARGVGYRFKVVGGVQYIASILNPPSDFEFFIGWSLFADPSEIDVSKRIDGSRDVMNAFSTLTFTPKSNGYLVIGMFSTYGSEFSGTVPEGFAMQLELGSTATSYEPPTVTETPLPEVELRGLPNGTCDELVIKADGTCEVERRTGYIASYTDGEVTGEYVSTGNGLEAGASIVYELDEPTTEPQSPVTLPALPAPTFNQYHDSPVPSDTSTQYARDINLVLANLEAVQATLLGGE